MTLFGGILRLSTVGMWLFVRGKDELEDAVIEDVDCSSRVRESVMGKDGEYGGRRD